MSEPGMVLAFWVLAGLAVGGAVSVFVSRNLMHAIAFLIVAFIGNAGLFVTLSADFIAAAQILIYAGAISILMVFAVMLTPLASRDNGNTVYVLPALVIGLAFAGGVGLVAIDVHWPVLDGAALAARGFHTTLTGIGEALLGRYVLAFEVASVLLLAALIGAIALVREDRSDREVAR